MLFVCERVRKAAATKRQPQRAERAMQNGESGGVLPLATTTAADSRARCASSSSKRACERRKSHDRRHPSKIIRSCTGSAPANLAVATYVPGRGALRADLQSGLERLPSQVRDHATACSAPSFRLIGLMTDGQSAVLQMRSLPESIVNVKFFLVTRAMQV